MAANNDVKKAGPLDPVAPDEVIPAGLPESELTAESIGQPAKVMRIGSMVKQLLDEVRQAPLDEAGRVRLREIYEQSVRELVERRCPRTWRPSSTAWRSRSTRT